MQALAVVKQLDVFKQTDPKFVLVGVTGAVNPFGFQRFEHGFGHGIVVTIAFAAHALRHLVFFQPLPARFAGILNPSI